jgi:hypothetical protein
VGYKIPVGTVLSVCRANDPARLWQRHVTRRELVFDRAVWHRKLWLSTGWATISVTVEHDQVVDAAPIAKRFVGQSIDALRRWLQPDREAILDEVRGSSGALIFREGGWYLLTRSERIQQV